MRRVLGVVMPFSACTGVTASAHHAFRIELSAMSITVLEPRR